MKINKTLALKARFTSGTPIGSASIESRFQRSFAWRFEFLGRGPRLDFEIAPLALRAATGFVKSQCTDRIGWPVRVDHAIFEKMGTIFSGVDEVKGWNPKAFLRRVASPVQLPPTHKETKESQTEQHSGRSPVRHIDDQLVLSELCMIAVDPQIENAHTAHSVSSHLLGS
jgi:hypothetical protein